MKRPVGILNVTVVKAMKLKKTDLLGLSDPYVKLKIVNEKPSTKKTTVKHKNLNPEWNEEFSFVVKDPETQVLKFSVYDWEQVHILFLIDQSYPLSLIISLIRRICVFCCCIRWDHMKKWE